jgi:hypothetical protein
VPDRASLGERQEDHGDAAADQQVSWAVAHQNWK